MTGQQTPTIRRGWSLAVLAGALGLDLSGLGVLNAALPAIGSHFALSAAELQWIVAAYAVTFASLLLFGGRAADVFGRRAIFTAGLAVFGAAALIGALSPNFGLLVAARALQGAGAALSGPAALALLAEVFPNGPARDRAMSIYASVGAAGFSTGVVLGGVVTDLFGWRFVLVVSAAIAPVLVALVPLALPQGERSRQKLDLPGALLATAGLLLAVFGVSSAGSTLWALVAAAVLLVVFVAWERRVAQPLLPPALFKSVPVLVSSMAAVLNYTAGVGLLFFAPLYLQGVLGYSPSLSGIAVVPSSVVLFATANLVTGRLLSRFGPRPPMIVGLILIAAAMAAWTLTPVNGSYLLHLLPGLVLTGIGQALVFPAMTVGSLTGVPDHQHGVAGAVNVTAQQIGSSVGVAGLVVVAAWNTSPGVEGTLAGYHAAYGAAALLCVAGAVVAAVAHKGWRTERA